jgi:hypothetical protein
VRRTTRMGTRSRAAGLPARVTMESLPQGPGSVARPDPARTRERRRRPGSCPPAGGHNPAANLILMRPSLPEKEASCG